MGNGQAIERRLSVLFITQEDPFYVRVLFEEFLKQYRERVDIKGVVICETIGKKSPWQRIRQFLDFYGCRDFLKMTMRYAIVTVQGCTLRKLFSSYDVPVSTSNGINSDFFISFWGSQGIDVIVSVASSEIFRKKLLRMPRWGCINIHHAKLPKYRGMMPNFWQMYFDEKSVGITVHQINEKIDDGKILLQRDIPIQEGETLDSLIRRTKQVGAHCVFEALEMIRSGDVQYIPNDAREGTYYSFPTRKDVRIFRSKGKRLL